MNSRSPAMDDQALVEALGSLHRERANLSDPTRLHRYLDRIELERVRVSESWRSGLPRADIRALLDPARLVAVGVVVAVFGGLLLAVAVPRPAAREDVSVAGTEGSSPRILASDTTAKPGLDPLGALVTEEVSPGVHRVIADAAGTDLERTLYVGVAPDGDIWFGKRSHVVRAGDPTRHPEATGPSVVDLITGSEGRAVMVDRYPLRSHDVSSWSDLAHQLFFPMVMTPGGSIWGTSPSSDGPEDRSLVVTRLDGDRPTHFLARDIGIASDDRCRTRVSGYHEKPQKCGEPKPSMAGSVDGTVWLGYAHYGGGLARFDGSEWGPVVPTGAAPHFGVAALTAGQDGTVWASIIERDFDVPDGGSVKASDIAQTRFLARFDGRGWMLFDWPMGCGCDEMHAGPAGEVWFPEPLMSFDGQTWKTYDVPRLATWKRRGIVNDLDVALDGTVLLAIEQDPWLRNGDQAPDRNERALFLLVPDGLAPLRTEGVTRHQTR